MDKIENDYESVAQINSIINKQRIYRIFLFNRDRQDIQDRAESRR